MPSFLDRALESEQERRQEKDPADLNGAKEPDWDNPDTWGRSGDETSDSDSASTIASIPAGENTAARPNPTSPRPAQTSRRRGRPRGPDRKPLSIRILAANDRMLTHAVAASGKNPQTLVDEALALLFRQMKIRDED